MAKKIAKARGLEPQLLGAISTMQSIVQDYRNRGVGGIDRDDQFGNAVEKYFEFIRDPKVDPKVRDTCTHAYEEINREAQEVDRTFPRIPIRHTGGGIPMSSYKHNCNGTGNIGTGKPVYKNPDPCNSAIRRRTKSLGD